jgi:hypothetical protein
MTTRGELECALSPALVMDQGGCLLCGLTPVRNRDKLWCAQSTGEGISLRDAGKHLDSEKVFQEPIGGNSVSDPIILQAKPSILPVFAIWTIPPGCVVCPLFALAFVFAQALGILANVLYLLGALFVVASLARLAIDIAQLECTLYTLTESQIIKQYGLLTQRQKRLPRDNSETEMQRPLAARIFNCANLKVTSAGLGSITLQYLPNAQCWQEEIKNQSTLNVNLEDRLASLRGGQKS